VVSSREETSVIKEGAKRWSGDHYRQKEGYGLQSETDMSQAGVPFPWHPIREEQTMKQLALLVIAVLAMGLLAASAAAAPQAEAEGGGATPSALGSVSSPLDLPDVAPPTIDGPISEAEMQDLQTVAEQKGISLQSAIDRYAWNDNFALAVANIRDELPADFTAAAIVNGRQAWIAFADKEPATARVIVGAFTASHEGISVDVHTDLGFTEAEIEKAVESVHYAVMASPDVRDATTSYDWEVGAIVSRVVLDGSISGPVLETVRAIAVQALVVRMGAGYAAIFPVSVVQSENSTIGTAESHYGGEILSGACTTAFGVITGSGTTGVLTAGHCGNAQADDGVSLAFQAEYQSTYGDFQWHTGPQAEPDDFYAGSSSATEVNLRDVSSIGVPVVGQELCRNGGVSHEYCQEVRALGKCSGSVCNLVEMGSHQSTTGDSGGPVFWGNQAYGVHRGMIYDPWPFGREVFSRTDKLYNALGIWINS